ncbi:barstar family protein [Streptomyces sp. MA15]|uniref:barstar family protein n=1 Tax=Streptomyces sp. MA15 TaxID=3055061 RepID=UPI00339D6A58
MACPLLALPAGRSTAGDESGASAAWAGELPTVQASGLPAGTRRIPELTAEGGPFPYERDGALFGDFEGGCRPGTTAAPPTSARCPRPAPTTGTPGVHRRERRDVLHRRPPRDVHGGTGTSRDPTARLVVPLALDGVTGKAGPTDRRARALGPPDRFGRDGDALADSLAGRPARPGAAAERGLLPAVRGRRAHADAPRERAAVQEVFAEAVERAPSLTVTLALGGSAEHLPDRAGRSDRDRRHGHRGRMKYVLFPLADLSGGRL